MGDEYGRMEWQTDEAAATVEAVRRIEAAIASGATALDFSDLSAMTRLPDALAKAHGVREINAGVAFVAGSPKQNFAERRLTDISALAGLAMLSKLTLSRTHVADLSPLSGLSGLTSLDLSDTPVFFLSPLSGLSGLTSLDLSNTPVFLLAPLSGLSGLTSLNLSNGPVKDLSALSGLYGLTSLDLSYTAVSDLSALSGLVGLTSLVVSGNWVSDLSALSGLVELTSLAVNDTQVSNLSSLSGLSGLASLDLSTTHVSDLGFLMSFPMFASEQAKFLRYDNTPAANPQADRRLDFLSRLPPDRCAIETVQYLKGTHPDFGPPQSSGLVNGGLTGLAERLAEASPVEVVLEGGLLQACNAGTPERVAPKELGLRVTALREQVGELLNESRGKQMPQNLVRRFERYAKALDYEEVTYLLLDGPIAALRGGLNDPYMTGALDGGFLGMWAELVKMHDQLRPLLLPPEEDDSLELRDDVTPEDVLEIARKVEDAFLDAEADGVVGSSMVEAVQASADYVQAAKSSPEQKRNWLKRGVMALGGFVANVIGRFIALGAVAGAAFQVQAFLATPYGQALVEKLRPLLEGILRLFFG